MAKRVVISHFFNEAYLLPWWLEHHRQIFDHGVLIDWNSTDGSADICRQLAPGWEVVPSENAHFAAILCDFEVMKHEARFPDAWKIALNTTEFLVAPELAHMETMRGAPPADRRPHARRHHGRRAPHQAPDPALPLTQQKRCGIWEDEFDFKAHAMPGLTFPTRSRIHHRYAIGAYLPGRHDSHLPGQCAGNRELGAVWWYGFSPWTDAFKARKLHISPRRDAFDRKHGFGAQHEVSRRSSRRAGAGCARRPPAVAGADAPRSCARIAAIRRDASGSLKRHARRDRPRPNATSTTPRAACRKATGDAADIFGRIFAADPDHSESVRHLGLIAHRIGNHERAAELISQAILLNPECAEAFADLGARLRTLGRHEFALQGHWRPRSRWAIAPSQALTDLAEVLEALGRPAEAAAGSPYRI